MILKELQSKEKLFLESNQSLKNNKEDKWKQEEDRILFRDIFYLFIVLWLSVFIAEYFFLDKNATPFDRIFGYIIIFLPLGTLNFLLHYLYRNRKIQLTGKLRSSLRYRLILAFLLVSIIPAMPIFLLTSSNVESIISVFFKLDLKGGMESAEEMLLYHENEFAKRFYDDILKNKNEIIYYINNIENIKKDKFIKFINRWLDENTDAIYVYDNLTLVKIYGTNLLKTKQIENFRDSYIVALIGNMKYVVVKIPLNQNMNILLLKKIYKNYEIYESKFRNVYSLLSKKEERFSEVIPYNLRLSLAILYLAMIVVAIIVAILLARQISHPIVSLAAATRKVTEGNLDIRIDEKSEGEIAILIQSFNSMTEELQTLRSRLLHSLRVAAWQEVARRLAHEIKNPLTPIQLSAERMLRKLEQNNIEDLKKAVRSGSNTIIEQVNVLKHLLEEFSNFTRLPSAKLELQNIVPLVKESTDLFKNIPDVIIEVRAQDNLPKLYLDKNLFIGMMNNLLKNAVEAVKEKYKDNTKKGVVLVSITTQKRMGKMFVILKVEDNGPGIPDELKEKIFEPYFSTKEGYGSGLGLALVERAVMEHNARILVLDSSLGGAEFRIIFQVP
ncbi:MAG: ATP-binding protein [Leptospiraceae bacterium]|jgi:nitrogen fixation/metabolism regulation signal transduction histidine kinase|nr:ATP-binding protein [Leptospiraceae bacterium]